MHSRLAAVIEYADSARTELIATVDAVPETLREARPSEDAWSVAEILEHLMRVEKSVAKLIAMKAAELQSQGEPSREAAELAALDVARFAGMPNRELKRAAPERTLPRGELSAAEALDGLTQSHQQLLAQLHAADGLALSTASHPHPLLGMLDMYEWVWANGAHELRHAAQIREVAEQLGTH